MMEILHNINKALQENLSATRNASRISSIDWDRILVALDLRLVPTLGDPLQGTLISAQAAAFW